MQDTSKNAPRGANARRCTLLAGTARGSVRQICAGVVAGAVTLALGGLSAHAASGPVVQMASGKVQATPTAASPHFSAFHTQPLPSAN